MCQGIAILRSQVPDEVMERYALRSRVVTRGGEYSELHFMRNERKPLLPVFHGGQLKICEWGNRNGRSKLPRSGWYSMEAIEAGTWRWLKPEQIEIPANYGFEKGVWYQIIQGVRGVLVYDEQAKPHAYLLTKPATHYYQIMTRCNRMPVLIEQEI